MKRPSLPLFDPRQAYDGSGRTNLLKAYRRRVDGLSTSRHADLAYDRDLDWLLDDHASLDLASAMLRYLALGRMQHLAMAGEVLGWAGQLDLVHHEGEGDDISWKRVRPGVTFAPLHGGTVDLRVYTPVGRAHSASVLGAREAKRRGGHRQTMKDLALASIRRTIARVPYKTVLPEALRGLDLPPVGTIGEFRDNLPGFASTLRPWRAVEVQWHVHRLAKAMALDDPGLHSPPELAHFELDS